MNFGAPAGEKGYWNNGTGNPVGRNGNALQTNPPLEEVPFRPWAKALYEYPQAPRRTRRSARALSAAGGMRFFTVPNGMEFIEQPDLKRIILIAGKTASGNGWRWNQAVNILPRTT